MWGSNYGGYPQGQQYGNQFGSQFGQYGQMPQGYGQPMQVQGQVQPMRDDRIWVEGEEAARAYLVAVGSSAVLWDNNRDTIYFKQTDSTGRPLPMMILDFTVRDQNQKPDYVTRQEFQQLVNALFPQNQAPAQQANATVPAAAGHDETEVNNG